MNIFSEDQIVMAKMCWKFYKYYVFFCSAVDNQRTFQDSTIIGFRKIDKIDFLQKKKKNM